VCVCVCACICADVCHCEWFLSPDTHIDTLHDNYFLPLSQYHPDTCTHAGDVGIQRQRWDKFFQTIQPPTLSAIPHRDCVLQDSEGAGKGGGEGGGEGGEDDFFGENGRVCRVTTLCVGYSSETHTHSYARTHAHDTHTHDSAAVSEAHAQIDELVAGMSVSDMMLAFDR